jgi:hypothetical protein
MQSGRRDHVNMRQVASVGIDSILDFRQGLWTEGLRTPPGQECSNGSLTRFAVVLWRIFHEAGQSEDSAFRRCG